MGPFLGIFSIPVKFAGTTERKSCPHTNLKKEYIGVRKCLNLYGSICMVFVNLFRTKSASTLESMNPLLQEWVFTFFIGHFQMLHLLYLF